MTYTIHYNVTKNYNCKLNIIIYSFIEMENDNACSVQVPSALLPIDITPQIFNEHRGILNPSRQGSLKFGLTVQITSISIYFHLQNHIIPGGHDSLNYFQIETLTLHVSNHNAPVYT